MHRTLVAAVLLALPRPAVAQAASDGPIEFGRARLEAAAKGASAAVTVALEPDRPPESFTITPGAPQGEGARVTAADATGAMYGLLELAERVRSGGLRALATTKVDAAPFLRDRGLNLFLTLPWNYEDGATDYDPGALIEPGRWWFQDDEYWTTLLDTMAESRLDWLDLHGMWDIAVTDAPNLYAYFIQSERYPEVGVAPAYKERNLARLNQVIERAHARGIRVSLMAYEARLATPHRRDPPYPGNEATAYDYTRDVVERMIRQAPGLDAIGFRIGESGRGGDFFRCYGEAIERSGRDLPLITRSWVTRKEKVVPLARASSDFTVEIKYDGEQWGAPYPFAGGRVANWGSYSFEDYLSDSVEAGAPQPKRTWPGRPGWPDQPYKIVWQVRANGTHRIFPHFDPEWVRRSVEAMDLGAASGCTIEPLDAYYPASPRYYVADRAQLPCAWIHQRDELFLMQWGRLAYDPKTPDAVFDQRLRERFGAAAAPLAKGWRAASRIVPLSLLAHAFGPDHRDYAPELEWGGSTREWIEGEGLDTHAFLPIREEIALRSTGGSDGRPGALDVADELDGLVATVEASLVELNRALEQAPEKGRAFELRCALEQLARLGRYQAGRQRSAWWSALADAAPGTDGARWNACEAMTSAAKAWSELGRAGSAAADFYRPFTEQLRMHTGAFTWRDADDDVGQELQRLEQLAKATGALPAAARAADAEPERDDRLGRRKLPSPRLAWKDEGDEVVVRLPAQELDRAWLLIKPLPSSTFFHKVAMERRGDHFEARFPRERWGHLIAAEIARGDVVVRLPDPLRETPWRVIPSQAGPTPLVYSTAEALDHLDPERLDPRRHGLIVIAPRAWTFWRSFDVAAQRKLLDAVERGCTLLVLQQDVTSGRYPLDWLDGAPKVENFRSDLFDPGERGNALRLEVARAPDVITQRFLPTDGWEVAGDGGIAHARRGEGEIWMVQARLIQNLHVPACARDLLQLLRSGGSERPVVLVDPGTEGGRFSTSLLPDFMNAHSIPFLTLGELIANEQGAAAIVAGRPSEDLLLGGKGAAQLQAFLDAQARASAARPLATTREEFEAQRPAQKQLVMQSLGLDPLPPRTPLNAQVVGTIERDGYRIEKVVFESRPGFLVTAHLYVPTRAAEAASNGGGGGGAKFPVIVHGHGHWKHKKFEPTLQQIEIQQALRGYLALIVDTPGHSFEGDATKIERRFQGAHDDFRCNLGSMNTNAVYVWDLMRALDWLATRPDADLTRVGVTGASGGGLATLWAFAADERFTCAVPVCFPTSLEIEPHNGCPCNHVPGTLRIGDRADTLAVRAPAPVLLIGADQDEEFPPAGTRRSGEKLQALWSLFGKQEDASWRVFHSTHDYNLEMTAAALDFFDRHLKGKADAAPVALTEQPTVAPDTPELVCLAAVPPGAVTMRDLAVAKLDAATKAPPAGDAAAAAARFVAFNGGLPPGAATNVVARTDDGRVVPLPASAADVAKLGGAKLYVTFESEPGLTIPGVLWLPDGAPRGAVVMLCDAGKQVADARLGAGKLALGGFACFAIDARGYGELDGLDLRLLLYRNQSPAFAAAIDLQRAAALLRPLCPKVGLVGDGPASSLAVLCAALVTPDLAAVIGRGSMREFGDAFAADVPLLALQQQADLLPPLPRLREAVTAPAQWTFKGERGFDLFAALLRLMKL